MNARFHGISRGCAWGLLGTVLFAGAAQAQDAPAATGAAPASAPQVGEIVLDEGGQPSANFIKNHFCAGDVCHDLVIDRRSKALISVDGQWGDTYRATGQGAQIIRDEPYDPREAPQVIYGSAAAEATAGDTAPDAEAAPGAAP